MPGERTRSLIGISAIRRLQEQAREMTLVREARALKAQLEKVDEESGVQGRREATWASVLQGRFDPIMARAWSAEVAAGAAVVAQAEADAANMRSTKEAAAQALQGAQARTQAANRLRDQARREARRAAESRQLDDIAERFSGRGFDED